VIFTFEVRTQYISFLEVDMLHLRVNLRMVDNIVKGGNDKILL
jgi:hypothetical protein